MAIDIKAKIEEISKKILGDKNLLANFKNEPVKVIEDLLGIDLPDEQLKPLIEGVKAKIASSDISSTVGNLTGKLGGLFGKK